MNWSRSRLVAVFYFLVAAPVPLVVLSALPQHAAPQPPANEIVLGIDPVQSKVHWTLESTVHTVHGSFAFKKGNLQLDTSTGKTSGEIVVDAASGNSGNDSRDKKMHKEVLESARYAELAADHWTGSAKFNVPFIDWGLKNPGNFFLKVNHAVEIELELK